MDQEPLSKKQQKMHEDFFDRCQLAIDQGFYLEAIAMEYAAMEGRLEVMLGLFDMPCSKEQPADLRGKINISHRIACLNYLRSHSPAMEGTKLDRYFFSKEKNKALLLRWTTERNVFIHGLYKNADLYQQRKSECQELAVQGKEYCRLLYNEVKRLRRLQESRPEVFEGFCGVCQKKNCKAFKME